MTSRRHGPRQLNAFRQDPDCVHLSLRLRDRFADHGLVSVLIVFQRGDVLDIDTWLMSCRVIGRTVESELLDQLAQRAVQRGCRWIRGPYIPTSKNAMVADLYNRLGFTLDEEHDGTTEWLLDVRSEGMPQAPGFIEVTCDVA